MNRIAAVLAVLFALSAAEARAQVTVGAGLQYFHWSEETTPIAVRESGPAFALALALAPRTDEPVRLAYRGQATIGIGDYHGSLLGAPRVPVSTTTAFGTMAHEGQIRVRAPGDLELALGFGFDWWHRQLGPRQGEDYQMLSTALALERGARSARGWSGGAGVRIPLGVREDAHFTDQGYDRDPVLKPGGRVGFYGRVADRLTPRLALVGSFEAFRLGASDPVTLTVGGRAAATAFQPATRLLILGIGIESSW